MTQYDQRCVDLMACIEEGHVYNNEPTCSRCGHYGPGDTEHQLRERLRELHAEADQSWEARKGALRDMEKAQRSASAWAERAQLAEKRVEVLQDRLIQNKEVPMSKPSYLVVLSALEAGAEVEVSNTRLRACEDEKGRPVIGIKLDVLRNDGTKEVRYVVCDWPLNMFMKECAKLTRDELALISANAALNSIHNERRTERLRLEV